MFIKKVHYTNISLIITPSPSLPLFTGFIWLNKFNINIDTIIKYINISGNYPDNPDRIGAEKTSIVYKKHEFISWHQRLHWIELAVANIMRNVHSTGSQHNRGMAEGVVA